MIGDKCEQSYVNPGLQQAVPAAGVARGDAGAERGAPLLGDAQPAGGDTGGGGAQGGDAAGRRRRSKLGFSLTLGLDPGTVTSTMSILIATPRKSLQ